MCHIKSLSISLVFYQNPAGNKCKLILILNTNT